MKIGAESWGKKQLRKLSIEAFTSWKDSQPSQVVKGIDYNPDCNVIGLVKSIETTPSGKIDYIYDYHFGRNIVTNDGDKFYATQGVGCTPAGALDFDGANGRLQLRNSADTPAATDNRSNVLGLQATTRKAIDACYPKVNDGDTDNPGTVGCDVGTWRVSYLTSEANVSCIQGGIICAGGACPGACQQLLTHFSIAAFSKTASDTLKMFINHTFNGV